MIDKLIMLVIGLAVGFLLGWVVCAVMTMKMADEARSIIDRERQENRN